MSGLNGMQIAPGVLMALHIVAATVLGWVVGYERYFNGRVAGTQVYCLVSLTSCAVTLVAGYPGLWYWHVGAAEGGDPTRVIGSILTGIGFLGAGILINTGNNVRGLTTAASIWGSSAIGILVGIGFYSAAITVTVLFIICMSGLPLLERRLPSRGTLVVTLRYRKGFQPHPDRVRAFLKERGLYMPPDRLSVSFDGERFEFECTLMAGSAVRTSIVPLVAEQVPQIPDIESFAISHSSRE
jgi:putative Mg2+ transporter-C (MgtC) family protein